MKSILPYLIGFLAFCCATNADELPPEYSVKQVIHNLLSRDQYMRYGEHGLHYAEACAALGALRAADKLGDKPLLERLIQRYEVLLEPSTDLISMEPHVDFRVIGIIPLQVHLLNGSERHLAFGLNLANEQWKSPREDGLTRETRYWIDDMYMVGSLQIQAFRCTGETVYADRAARFFADYLDKLQQDNGLFFHGTDAPFFWGRGNGWVASALAETLRSIPNSHPLHASILEGYMRMMRALKSHQADSGMWRQLVDHPESWEESSATAMFAFAMQVGISEGWLPKKQYQHHVRAAWKALLTHLDAQGNLTDICVGTGQSKDVQYYLDRPRHDGDFHGQAPFLWLATELLQSD